MASLRDLRKRLELMGQTPGRREPEPAVPHRGQRLVSPDAMRTRANATPAGAAAPTIPAPQSVDAAIPPIFFRRNLPYPLARRPYLSAGPPVSLQQVVQGEEMLSPAGGRAFVTARDVRELGAQAAEFCAAFARTLLEEGSGARRWIDKTVGQPGVAPEDVLFLDIETTGLSCTPLFLIGTMAWERGGLVVRQFFARDYAEEPSIIALFLDNLRRKKLLVSFNGKTFDLPYIRVRSAATLVPFDAMPGHFDLLQVARRIWRGVLPDCRLQTLERCICGRARTGDIPGEAIPQAYHDYVLTRDARVMAEVMRHNMLDLITIADLMVRLPGPARRDAKADGPRRSAAPQRNG